MAKPNKRKALPSIFLSMTLFVTCLAGPSRIAQADASPPDLFPGAIYKDIKEEPITRGVVHTHFEAFDSLGWLKGDILTVDLQDSNVGTDLLYPGKLSATATPEKMGKDSGAIAIVNGDFFDISRTNVPIGPVIRNGDILKTGQFRGQSIGITSNGLGSIFHFSLSGLVANISSSETPRLPLGGINEHDIRPNELFMFTHHWGTRSRAPLVKGQPLYAEVVVQDNTVMEVLENQLYSGAVGENMYLLLGYGAAAEIILAGYKPGDTLNITMNTNIDPKAYQMVLGGDVHLVVDGQPQKFPTNPYRHPRTGMGFSKDGKTLYLAVVDGRQKDSRGMSYDEMAQFMASLGAWSAINLDSGGSTQMLSRPLGEQEIKITNSPSNTNGAQRYIPNAVGLFSTASGGQPLGFKVDTLTNRVFTGLSRTFGAKAYDEFYNPININIQGPVGWAASDPALGHFDQAGIFRGGQKGSGDIVIQSGSAQSTYPVQVLGQPTEIFPDIQHINNGKAFKVYARNGEDYHALIESRDIQLKYDNALLEVKAQADHSFRVTSKMDNGTALIEIQAGGLKTWVGVAAGYDTIPVTGFESHGAWTFDKFPQEVAGSVAPVLKPVISGMALRMDYNFARTAETRAAYMVANPEPLALPNGTRKLGLQVFGSAGNGHWLRGTLLDSTGKSYTIDFAKNVKWDEWKYVEAAIPSEVQYPIALEKIYLVSTDPENLTAGCIVIDDLVAKVPQQAQLPPEMKVGSPLLDEANSTFQQGMKFVVISNLEINSTEPQSPRLTAIEMALKKAQSQGANLVFMAGNTVAGDTAENYRLADQFLKNALSSTTWHALPGSRDIRGTGSLARFRQTLGQDFQIFDNQGTRFVLLNMATGSWRTSNGNQWIQVKKTLEEAKSNSSIKNVVVVNSLPIPNGVTLKTSGGISDAKEAELLQKLLADFREKSGKPVAFISGQGELAVDRLDGISYIGVGNDCPVFSINPSAENWLQVLRNPIVD